MATRDGPDDPRCRDCPRPRPPARANGRQPTRCKDCAAVHNARTAKHRAELSKRHRCVVCGAAAAPDRRFSVRDRRTRLCTTHQRYYADRAAAVRAESDK